MSPDDALANAAEGEPGEPWLSDALYRQRLRETLGINAAGVEVILHLRRQLTALQARVRQLEVQLGVRQEGQRSRLTQYRQTCIETSWQEVVDAGEPPCR
jgi:hypothetical protein